MKTSELSNTLLYLGIGDDITSIIQLLDMGYNYTNVIAIDAQPGHLDYGGNKDNYFNLILSHFKIYNIQAKCSTINSFPWTFEFAYRDKSILISLYYSVYIPSKHQYFPPNEEVKSFNSVSHVIPDKHSILIAGFCPSSDIINKAEYKLLSHGTGCDAPVKIDALIHPWEIDFTFPVKKDPKIDYIKEKAFLVSKACRACQDDADREDEVISEIESDSIRCLNGINKDISIHTNVLIYPNSDINFSNIIYLLDIGFPFDTIICTDKQPGFQGSAGDKENYFRLLKSVFNELSISVKYSEIEDFPWTFEFQYNSKDIIIKLYYSVYMERALNSLFPVPKAGVQYLDSIKYIIPEKYSIFVDGLVQKTLIDNSQSILLAHDCKLSYWRNEYSSKVPLIMHPWSIHYLGNVPERITMDRNSCDGCLEAEYQLDNPESDAEENAENNCFYEVHNHIIDKSDVLIPPTLLELDFDTNVSKILHVLDYNYNFDNIICVGARARIKIDKLVYYNIVKSHFDFHNITVESNSVDSYPWTFKFNYNSTNINLSVYYLETDFSDEIPQSILSIIPDKYTIYITGWCPRHMIDKAQYKIYGHGLAWEDAYDGMKIDKLVHPPETDFRSCVQELNSCSSCRFRN